MEHNIEDHIHNLEQKAENLQSSVNTIIFYLNTFIFIAIQKGEIYRMCQSNGRNIEY